MIFTDRLFVARDRFRFSETFSPHKSYTSPTNVDYADHGDHLDGSPAKIDIAGRSIFSNGNIFRTLFLNDWRVIGAHVCGR